MSIFTDTTTYRVVCCYKCSVTFGMPMGLYLARKNDHEIFWCPNGHEQVFMAKSEADQLRRVAAGVCPCCQRTFKNLADHMKGQHPDFGGGEGEG